MLPLGRNAAVRSPCSPPVVAANEHGERRYMGYHDHGEITHENEGWPGNRP